MSFMTCFCKVLLTRSTSEELKDEVENIIDVIGPLGCLARGIVTGAVLWRDPVPICTLTEGVQVVCNLCDVGGLRLLAEAPAQSARICRG